MKALFATQLSEEDLKVLKTLTINYNTSEELKAFDQHLPCMAFIRYTGKESKGVRPLECCHLFFQEKLNGVRLIQTFIHSKGTVLLSSEQPSILIEYRDDLAAPDAKESQQIKDPAIQLYRRQREFTKSQDEWIKHFNKPLLDEIRVQLRYFERYLKAANGGAKLLKFSAKFIER